jgi:hypothetical protein
MERLGTHVSAQTNSRNNRRAVFSVRSVPRGYKHDKEVCLRQSNSGVGSCSRELRESPELAVDRIIEKKWQEWKGCAKKTS